jgi:hypothetical protein
VIEYYDHDGNPMSHEDWVASFENPKDKHVCQQFVDNYWVSTTWLGLDHNWGGGPPLIFETMVFRAVGGEVISWESLLCERYSTEKEALRGHMDIVRWIKEGKPLDEYDRSARSINWSTTLISTRTRLVDSRRNSTWRTTSSLRCRRLYASVALRCQTSSAGCPSTTMGTSRWLPTG